MIQIIKKPSLNLSLFNNTNHFSHLYAKCTRLFHITQKSLTPTLTVNPQVCLYDVKPSIRVDRLEPLKPITLKAQMRDDKGKLLFSNAHYIADENGVVDVAVNSSLNGSYKGIFPSGLLSSLKFSPENFQYGTIHKNDMNEPIKIRISVLDGHKPVEVDEGELDSIELHRHLIAKGVQRIPVKEGRVRGVLYIPEGDGPFPGVIDMFGAGGNLIETRAALNAARGIASLSLAYYNFDDITTEHIYDPDVAYVEEAIDYLLSHPKILADRCGTIGNCFGGTLSYHTSLYLSKIKATFLINTSYTPYVSDIKYRGKYIAKSAYSEYNVWRKDTDEFYIPTEEYNKMLSNVHPYQVEAFKNTMDDQYFAVALGEQDVYTFYKGWQKFSQHLNEDKKKNLIIKTYPRAGHNLYPPYTPVTTIVNSPVFVPQSQNKNLILIKVGGETQDVVEMQEGVWQWMFDFFKLHLGDNKKI